MIISESKVDELIAKLKFVASKHCLGDKPDDELNMIDICGGNFDDAYAIGTEDGARLYARELLHFFGVEGY